MDFSELVLKRYSVRSYSDKVVEKEKLTQILKAFQFAPSACNKQPFRLFVFKTKGKEALFQKIYPPNWFSKAPLVLLGCIDESRAWIRKDGKNYALIDLAIAFDHLVMQATELGLGTCWVAAFDPKKAKELLKLPANLEPVIFTPLGYALDSPAKKIRKELSEIVKFVD
ncbi:MAG: nitroreductase family protein [Candidatus Diapherotrites archaeon]|nr:nitroreductase family protein [Candidatus Diapherotrites archaeon]